MRDVGSWLAKAIVTSIAGAVSPAAATWCRHAATVADKPWKYLLIPHAAITEASTLAGLAASHALLPARRCV